MRAMTRISGRKLTIAIWLMSSPSKAKSPKPSPTSCRPSFRLTRKSAIEQPPTTDVAAFDLYSRAKDHFSSRQASVRLARKNLRQAIELLNQALARDPSFFLAYCQLATRTINFMQHRDRSHPGAACAG